MDLSKLDQNEKLALYASIAVFLFGIISNWGGLFWLAVLAALGVAVVVLLPQFSPSTSLPGSKGTLMATLGIVALASGIIEVLRFVEYFLNTLGRFSTIAFIIALVGAVVMAYAGWMELQKEGGKWAFGSQGATPAPAPEAAAETAPPGEPAAPEPMQATEPPTSSGESGTPGA